MHGAAPSVTGDVGDVIQGTPAPLRDAVVAIVGARLRCEDAQASLVCTGTLVAPRVVVTAAHCVAERPPSSLEVFFGADIAQPGAFVYVAEIAIAPGFDPQSLANDLAVVRLAADAPAKPLPLSTQTIDATMIGAHAKVVGFGEATAGARGGVRLEGSVVIASVAPTTVTVTPGPELTCNGDSGGPLLLTSGGVDYVAGATSFGDTRCAEHTQFTRVDAFATFVESFVSAAGGKPPPPVVSPRAGTCSACASDADCAPGLACDASDPTVSKCAFIGLPAATIGDACATNADCGGDACLAMPSGSARACFCYKPCSDRDRCDAARSPLPGLSGHTCTSVTPSSGCATTASTPGAGWLGVVLVALAILRSRSARARATTRRRGRGGRRTG